MITIGMDYEVAPGRNGAFEAKFARVVEAMQGSADHVGTTLYRDVAEPQAYLVVSEWKSRTAFDAFVRSEAFRRTTEWGRRGILRARPRHRVYGGEAAAPTGDRCPAHGVDSAR
jgi:heme-degrading monooxygenase HmoA